MADEGLYSGSGGYVLALDFLDFGFWVLASSALGSVLGAASGLAVG